MPPQVPTHQTHGTANRKDLQDRLSQLESVFETHDISVAHRQVADVRRDFERPAELLVFVFGEGNFGKSSLINAIVGRCVAPVHFLPKTWRVDLYQSLSNSEEEYALITTAGATAPERLSIQQAQERCSNQEADAQQALKKTELSALGELQGQIIEVRWHLHGLALPPNIILVDTPGFSQFRAGLNEARAAVLESTQGVAFDIQEVYERFFHRAHVVLWAFRADKLESDDTQNVFTTLASRGKLTLGILTWADKVRDRLEERKATAQRIYGRGVQEFIPVIVGERATESGFGVAYLRERLQALSHVAEDTRCKEVAQFCEQQRHTGQQWLCALGDTLIQNVSYIALYCNGTSDRLLREAQERQRDIESKYRELVATRLIGLEAFLSGELDALRKKTRWKFGLQKESEKSQIAATFSANLHEYLQIGKLNDFIRSTMANMAIFVQAQGELIAGSYKMEQVVLETAGTYRTRSLNTQIKMPDTTNLFVSIPTFQLPTLQGGFFAALERLFGGKRQEELQTMLQGTRAAVEVMAASIQQVVPMFVKRIAEEILASADVAIADLYPGQKLSLLARQAENTDRSLEILQRLAPNDLSTNLPTNRELQHSPHGYSTRFRMWSPRDDSRAAAIDFFCEWFAQAQETLRHRANGWIGDALSVVPLNHQQLRSCTHGYVRKTRWTRHRVQAPLLQISNGKQSVGDILTVTRVQMATQLRNRMLFDEVGLQRTLLADFEFFSLTGIASKFSVRLCESFERQHQMIAARAKVQTPQPPSADQLKTRLKRSLGASVGAPLALTSVADVAAVYAYHVALWQSLVISIPLLASGSAVIFSGVWWNWRRSCFQEITSALQNSIRDESAELARKAWLLSLEKLDQNMAREIVGSETLLKKKPLDYAIEGRLDYS